MKVAKVESKSSPSLMPIPANQLMIIKSVVVLYFIAIYMADQETADPWRHLTPKDFNTYRNSVFKPVENHWDTKSTKMPRS